MITETILSEAQISRAQRAADQRRDYTVSPVAGPGTPAVDVRNLKTGARYLVTFSGRQPVCTCADHERNPHLICKHGVLVLAAERDAQPPAPATISDAEWNEWQREFSEDRLPWNAPPFDVEPGEPAPVPTPAADAFRKRHAQALRDRELWN